MLASGYRPGGNLKKQILRTESWPRPDFGHQRGGKLNKLL